MQKINEEEVKKFWDKRAELYGKVPLESIVLFKTDETVKERDKKLKKTIDSLIPDKQQILELGCSTGRLSTHMAKRAKFVLGVDYSKPLLDIARKESEGITNVVFIESDVSAFDYHDKFDIILVSGLFHYLNDNKVKKTIKIIKKHLKTDGKVIIKESIGIKQRVEIIDKYSKEIHAKYNSIYRTKNEIIALFSEEELVCLTDYNYLQHRKDTAIWFFIFKEEKNERKHI